MVHPGCGADIIRQRRRADQLKKEQQKEQQTKLQIIQSSLESRPTRPKNKRYHGHYTPARNSQVFNGRCSSLRLSCIQEDKDFITTNTKVANRKAISKCQTNKMQKAKCSSGTSSTSSNWSSTSGSVSVNSCSSHNNPQRYLNESNLLQPKQGLETRTDISKCNTLKYAVSYTHLTLPTNREV